MVTVKGVKIFIDKENGEEQRNYGEIFETTEERASYLHSHGAVVYIEEPTEVKQVGEIEEPTEVEEDTEEETTETDENDIKKGE